MQLATCGQDPDDEMAAIMMRALIDGGHVEVRAMITTLEPAFDRARLLRGQLDLLGMHGVPVGIGSDGGDLNHSADRFEKSASMYMPSPHHESVSLPRA